MGDADSNGTVNTMDAMRVLQYYAGLLPADRIARDLSDVDGNGTINTVDAMLILRYYAGLITRFPADR